MLHAHANNSASKAPQAQCRVICTELSLLSVVTATPPRASSWPIHDSDCEQSSGHIASQRRNLAAKLGVNKVKAAVLGH